MKRIPQPDDSDEGWVLMRLPRAIGDPELWEIQRDDEQGVFSSDIDAVSFVRTCSKTSRHHELSLRVHELSHAYLGSKTKWAKQHQ